MRPYRSPITLLLGLALLMGSTTAWGQTNQRREPTLRQRLVAGLQVRRPSEFAFIDAVVDTVDRGDLPERLVDRFFFWARNRSSGKSIYSKRIRRPIIDFQAGLTVQANKLKIAIEADPSSTP